MKFRRRAPPLKFRRRAPPLKFKKKAPPLKFSNSPSAQDNAHSSGAVVAVQDSDYAKKLTKATTALS